MKNLVLIVVAAVFLGSMVSFFGVGFGLGALNATGLCTSAAPNTNCLTYSTGGISDGTIQDQVISTSINAGSPFVSSLEAGTSGSTLQFEAEMSSYGSCAAGNLRADAWQGGYQAFYEITFSQTVTANINGSTIAPVSGAGLVTGTTFFVSYNYTGGSSLNNLVGCAQSGGEIHGPVYAFETGITLIGQYPVISFSVAFITSGLYCDGAIGSSTSQCFALGNGPGEGSPPVSNGAWWIGGTMSGIVLSADASFQIVDSQNQYNGGTLSVIAFTGYGSYSIVVDSPAARGGGTAPWSSNPQSVPNYCLSSSGCPISWKIPANAAIADGGNPALDTFDVILYSTFDIGQDSKTTVINPTYSPTTPVITYSTTGGGLYPGVGNNVTLTIYSNSTSTSGPPVSMSLIAYYLPPGAGVEQSPGCGAAYITPCNGAILDLAHSGAGVVGTYSFSVEPPLGDTQIGLEAISSTNNSPSLPGYFLLQIKPAGCQLGQTCDPLRTTYTTWGLIGPILLSIILVSGSILLAIFLPLGWIRYVPIVVAGTVVAILYVFGIYTEWFTLGGALNSGVQ
jgi:hypothetical protein